MTSVYTLSWFPSCLQIVICIEFSFTAKMKNCKFLIAGDVKGQFEKLFKKVASVHKKKGPFDFLVCVGSFFGNKDNQWEHYIKNCLDVPLSVYILGPNDLNEREFYPDDLNRLSEINPKITYLGKRGIFTTCEGLKIGFLSGTEGTNNECTFDKTDLKTLTSSKSNISDAPIVDVFVTSVWPDGVTQLHNAKLQPNNGSKLLASVLNNLQPWYHFAGHENVFYERAPYSNQNSSGELSSVTRFIALANVTSSDKWLHAISLDIPKKFTHSELQMLAGIVTSSPFGSGERNDTQSYRYDMSKGRDTQKRSRGDKDQKKKMKIDAEKDCWFCLSSGKAENHLIISVGTHAYLSLNRGGLVSQHLNIFPIEHIASMSQASEAVFEDVKTFRTLLKKYFIKMGFPVIFFERYYKTFHSQIHCIPLLPEMADDVEKIFVEKLEELDSIDYEISENETYLNFPPEQNYFHVTFPNGLNLVAKVGSRFPLNFGRDVLVNEALMNAAEKADWRNCVLPVEEETTIVNELRNSIKYK